MDTAETSVQCIKFLQQHGLGRASFSILDKMEVNRAQAMKPFHGPENVPRLFDLLHVSIVRTFISLVRPKESLFVQCGIVLCVMHSLLTRSKVINICLRSTME